MLNAEQWSRVKGLFDAALERDAPERPAFLDAACHGDLALRAEIDRLLAAHAQSASFIERSPIGGDSGGASLISGTSGNSGTDGRGASSGSIWNGGSDVRTTMTGRVIGHYEVGRLLGSGGMGEVYAARDVELARDVALKVATLSDEDAQTRLKREAQHASQLSHPNICTIHEIGRCDGQVYIVMEYIEGPVLSDVIPRLGLSIESVLRYGIQIADAVAHAHEHGISHRDLKSANVVITPDARAKVLDFGLARRLAAQRLDAISKSQRSLTEEGLIAGTLPSMAPELLRGEPADQRSDIWSLGVLLYEMATGERPFTGATGFQVSAAILHEPPGPLPARIPSSLQATIRRCLMKGPAERYKHAAEIRSALEAVQAEIQGEAVRTPRFPRLPLQVPRSDRSARNLRRAAAGFAGLYLAVVLVAAVAWRWTSWTTGDDGSVAVGVSGHPAIAVMNFDVEYTRFLEFLEARRCGSAGAR